MPHGRTRKSTALLLWIAFLAATGGCSPQVPTTLAPLPSPPLDLGAPQVANVIASIADGQDAKVAKPTSEVDELACEGFRPWKYIVIHHSATETGNAAILDRMHRARGFDELGYHFVISNGRDGPDGRVEASRRWRVQKWGAHTGGTPGNEYNNFGIGICLVGDFTSKPPSAKQLAVLGRLLARLTERYDIAAENVITHRDAPNAATACPGDKLWTHLAAGALSRK